MATTSHVGSTGPWDGAGRRAAGTAFRSNPGGCAQRGNVEDETGLRSSLYEAQIGLGARLVSANLPPPPPVRVVSAKLPLPCYGFEQQQRNSAAQQRANRKSQSQSR